MTGYVTMIAIAEEVGSFLSDLNDGALLNENEMEIYASIYEFKHGGLIPDMINSCIGHFKRNG